MGSIFFIIFGAIVLYMLYQIISKGGFKGAIFGSKVKNMVGEIPLESGIVSSKVLRVHLLENGGAGIELTAKAILGFSMTGFTVKEEQLDKLIEYLQNAKSQSINIY